MYADCATQAFSGAALDAGPGEARGGALPEPYQEFSTAACQEPQGASATPYSGAEQHTRYSRPEPEDADDSGWSPEGAHALCASGQRPPFEP